jgi:hypothetical protein
MKAVNTVMLKMHVKHLNEIVLERGKVRIATFPNEQIFKYNVSL